MNNEKNEKERFMRKVFPKPKGGQKEDMRFLIPESRDEKGRKEMPAWEWSYREQVRFAFLKETKKTLRSMRRMAFVGNEHNYAMLRNHLAYLKQMFREFFYARRTEK